MWGKQMKVYHVAWFSSCICEIFLLQKNILPNKSQKMLRFVFGMWQTNKRKKKKKLFSRAQKLKSHIVMILIAYFGGGGLLLYLHIHKFFVERFAPPTMSALIRPSKINLFFFSSSLFLSCNRGHVFHVNSLLIK